MKTLNSEIKLVILQYKQAERAGCPQDRWLFDVYNITVNNLLSRQSFRDIFWKWSSIDKQLLDNVSAKCFSIGHYFDGFIDYQIGTIKTLDEILSFVTVDMNCFTHNNFVSNS